MLSPSTESISKRERKPVDQEILLCDALFHVIDKFLETLSSPPSQDERDRLRISLISLKEVLRTDPQRTYSFLHEKLELYQENNSYQKSSSPLNRQVMNFLSAKNTAYSNTPSPSPCINHPETPGRNAPSPIRPHPVEERKPDMKASMSESQKKADLLERVNRRTQNLLKNIEQRVKLMTENNELHQFLVTKNIVNTNDASLEGEKGGYEARKPLPKILSEPSEGTYSTGRKFEDDLLSGEAVKQKLETPKGFVVVSPILNEIEEEIDWESIEKIKKDLFGKTGRLGYKPGDKNKKETLKLIEKINAELKEIDDNSQLFESNLSEVEKLTEEFKEKYKDYKLKNILISSPKHENNQENDEQEEAFINSSEKIKNPMKLEKVLGYIYDFKRKFLSNTEVLLKIKDKMKFIETPSFLADEEEAERSGSSLKKLSIYQKNIQKPIAELSPNVNLKSIRIYRGESEKEYNYLDYSSRNNDSDNSID